MCGIFGVAAFNKKGINVVDLEIFNDLARVSTLRGIDGAGVFYVGDKDTELATEDGSPYVSWIKNEGNIISLMQQEEYKDHQANMMFSRFLVGHSRWKTIGEATVDNAHPFQYDHITMVHNGTIKEVNGKRDFGKLTDSEAICQELAKHNAKDVLETLDGAACLVWYDEKEQKLKIYRNKERPLSMLFYGSRMYFASEYWMLRTIINRKANGPDLKDKQPDIVNENVLYEFDHAGDCVETPIKPRPIYVAPVKPTVMNPRPRYKKVYDSTQPVNNVTQLDVDRTKDYPLLNKIASFFKSGDGKAVGKSPEELKNLIPMAEYWTLKRGDQVIFEPQLIEYLDEKRTRALISGSLSEVLPQRPMAYNMVSEVRIIAKTLRTPKIPPSQLYQYPMLCGVVESIAMDKNDITSVIANLVNVEPYDVDAYNKLQSTRKVVASGLKGH